MSDKPVPGTALVVTSQPPVSALARLRLDLPERERAEFRAALDAGWPAIFPEPTTKVT